MSLNARATLGFLLSALPELSTLFALGAPSVIPGVVMLLILAFLWWQYSKSSAWATWILGFLMAMGVLVSIGLGTTLWVLLVLASFGNPPQPDEATIWMRTVLRTLCYLAALSIVIFEVRVRASRSANKLGQSEGDGG